MVLQKKTMENGINFLHTEKNYIFLNYITKETHKRLFSAQGPDMFPLSTR